MAKHTDEDVEVVETKVEDKKIESVTFEFGREDLNALRDAVNALIAKQ